MQRITPEEQRRAIAIACKWERLGEYSYRLPDKREFHVDILSSQEAMHEALKILTTNRQRCIFLCYLAEVAGYDYKTPMFDVETAFSQKFEGMIWEMVNASPAQLADAFCLTLKI